MITNLVAVAGKWQLNFSHFRLTGDCPLTRFVIDYTKRKSGGDFFPCAGGSIGETVRPRVYSLSINSWIEYNGFGAIREREFVSLRFWITGYTSFISSQSLATIFDSGTIIWYSNLKNVTHRLSEKNSIVLV